MEEINLKELWNYYKKYLVYIVIITVLCALGMYFYSENVKKPMYSSSSKVVLVKDGDTTNDNGITQNDINLNQKLVSTYTQIIKSKLVVNRVNEELDLNYTYDKLLGEIGVTAVDDTELLKITVTDKNPETATTIANKIAEQL